MILEKPRPFLKWAGGKRWFVKDYSKFFPKKFRRYIEPFLGSGVVFFHLAPQRAFLSDTNGELIEAYRAIQADWKRVVFYLKKHQKLHCREYYYIVRSSLENDPFKKAARLIYLNRTCWNGLYRVNRNGQFNVPIGTRDTIIFQDDNFPGIAEALKGVQLEALDFEPVIDSAGKNDFIFVDPPYTVKHNHNGFVKYNQDIFSWEGQERLAASLIRASHRGAIILSTNANHRSVRSLYAKEFYLQDVTRPSSIASNSLKRGQVEELVISSYALNG